MIDIDVKKLEQAADDELEFQFSGYIPSRIDFEEGFMQGYLYAVNKVKAEGIRGNHALHGKFIETYLAPCGITAARSRSCITNGLSLSMIILTMLEPIRSENTGIGKIWLNPGRRFIGHTLMILYQRKETRNDYNRTDKTIDRD